MTIMTIVTMMMLMIKIKPSKIGFVSILCDDDDVDDDDNGYDYKKTFKNWVCLNDLLLDPGVLSTYRRQVLVQQNISSLHFDDNAPKYMFISF